MSPNILCLSGLLLLFAGCRETVSSGTTKQLPETDQSEASGQVTDYINFRSFQNPDRTWGFTIFINSRPFRHYNNIPYKNLNTGFISRIEAEKVAELFIAMIRNGDNSPEINKKIIDSMKLTIKQKRKLPD